MNTPLLTIKSYLPFSWEECVGFAIHNGPKEISKDEISKSGIVLPEKLQTAVAKRQAEFIFGRILAREGIQRLAPELAHITVGVGIDREPIWPKGIIGSITHSHGIVLAITALANRYQGIGIDIEAWLEEDQTINLAKEIATTSEVTIANKAYQEQKKALALIFSAKESLFKCLYPLCKIYFDFKDASVTHLDHKRKTLTIKLQKNLTPKFYQDMEFTVEYHDTDSHIVTGIRLP